MLPKQMKIEVNDFVDFLMKKRRERSKQKKPRFGCANGQIYISPDFDKPLDDFKEYMYRSIIIKNRRPM